MRILVASLVLFTIFNPLVNAENEADSFDTFTFSAIVIGEAGFIEEQEQVFIELSNYNSTTVRNISGYYQVFKENGKELFSKTFTPFTINPMTEGYFSFPWDYPWLETGQYTVVLFLNVLGESIQEQRHFEVINENTIVGQVGIQGMQMEVGIPPWMWALFLALLLAIMILLIAIMKISKGKIE